MLRCARRARSRGGVGDDNGARAEAPEGGTRDVGVVFCEAAPGESDDGCVGAEE